jgi:Homeodomain-like domain
MRELDRLECILAVINGELQQALAAERLGITTRQLRRLVVRYRLEGPIGLMSRHRNRPGNRRLKGDLENQVVRILRDNYPDFGPTLATKMLAERHRIVLAKETVRRIQVAAGMWVPRRLRPPKG